MKSLRSVRGTRASRKIPPLMQAKRACSVGEPKVCLRVGPVHIELRVNVTGEVRLASDAADYAGKSVARVDDAVDWGDSSPWAAIAISTGYLLAAGISIGLRSRIKSQHQFSRVTAKL